MTKRSVVLGFAVALFAGGLLIPRSAWAVPAFSRAYGVSCSTCHNAWPLLNATGRRFKENGYQFERGEPEKFETIGNLKIPVTFPWAAVTKFRPYDHTKDGDQRLRALHEVELFIAGNAWDYGSFFVELELEDEADFEVELAHGVGGFHPFQWGNILLGKSRTLHCDPYNTLDNGRKLTRSSRQALVNRQMLGYAVASEVQNVQICGREPFLDKVFYAAAYSADVGDPEGGGGKDWSGRLVFDVLPLDAVPDVDLSVGGFVINGHQNQTTMAGTRALSFTRYGFDLQFEYVGANLLFAFVKADDDIFAGGGEKNKMWYVEGFYAFDRDDLKSIGLPGAAIVPNFRVDRFEQMDGTRDFTDLTLNLSYYPWDNVRLYTEYFRNVDTPAGVDKRWRWTVQVEVAF